MKTDLMIRHKMKMTKVVLLLLLGLSTNLFAFSTIKNDKLTSSQQTQAAKTNDTIQYVFQLKNTTNTRQTYSLSVNNPRQLGCTTILSATKVTLEANKSFEGQLSVIVSDRIPVGGHETSFIVLKDEDNSTLETLAFISVRAKPHPFLLVTDAIFEETKQKIKNYNWANDNLEIMLKELGHFEFPELKIITKPRPTKIWSSLNYSASDGEKAFKLALAYKLTGNLEFRDKLISFIKIVTNKDTGYLSIGAATNGVQVHEGNFFLFLAAACDVVYNEPSFSNSDRENINNTFRYYLKLNKEHMNGLGIMNHQASANAGALLVALFLQDMAEVTYLIEADGGMADQIGKGVMADGWWFEGTANYCYLVTQRYTLVSQAFENYGLDLYHRRFPVAFKSKDFDNVKEGFAGMKFDNWGPTGNNTRGLEDMVTPYIPMMDENAYVVSSNDSNLKEPNEFYELAYREYKIDDLAWVINKTKRESWVSLMYGIPELPQVKDPRTESSFLPNVGLVALRSQPKTKTPKDQIQAYLKYGTHGGWHGHFDRASLIALDRNGHKYFGTEMVWFGYGNPGYKESVQTSATHNMVIVDELQQEAVPSEQLLFFKGEMMQASAVETNARWRIIPKWNADKFPPWDDTDYASDFNPIQQRRLSIVTDNYVVIADYMKSNKKHNYDWLLHPVGFKSISGAKKQGKSLELLSTNEDSPYTYFKNAQWYTTKKGTKIEFDEEGNKLDVYSIWPKKAEILLSSYPNGGKQRDIRNNPNRKTYGVRVNEKEVVFLNVIEPYQGESKIDKIVCKTADQLTIYLKDGREQYIHIENFEQSDFKIIMEERVNDIVVKTEIAKSK
ncbi:heparinase II/III family protein [Aureibaculum sp. A20]|uniref:Heparinase II/III family protein n=1 Tax=Aureibaculum flavum TaxID=2795986 RepID=A0ABS0WVB7_9FLAO|nr:heparinase II/III family protein [Aureibaculum flavum]MBJ2175937.1 heparinase II/III family protein [Aureibaculum flavum]